ncbi:hypothetical protein HKBW3C_03023, partial [Candidatus Hakubella thermalkaliphila]
FGVEKVEEILRQGNIRKIIFGDASLDPGKLLTIENEIYDQHRPDERKEEREVTSFDLLVKSRGREGFDEKKFEQWQKVIWLSDFRADADNMDLQKALKRMHLVQGFEDKEIYSRWFGPLFDSFFDREKDVDMAQSVFREVILQFLTANPYSPAKEIMQGWLKRLDNPEKFSSSLRNIFHFVSSMTAEAGKEWLSLTLRAVHEEQRLFQKAKEAFRQSDINLLGETLVISQITSNKRFGQAARNMIYSEKEEAPAVIRERITGRTTPWVVIQVSPENRNFLIFPGGGTFEIIDVIYSELTKALRAEILERRDKNAPSEDELCKAGTLDGTEFLYFHKMERGYPQILWGSLTHEAPPAKVFGETARKIRHNLVQIAMQALDDRYFPPECDPNNCISCPMYAWQLKKCQTKAKT